MPEVSVLDRTYRAANTLDVGGVDVMFVWEVTVNRFNDVKGAKVYVGVETETVTATIESGTLERLDPSDLPISVLTAIADEVHFDQKALVEAAESEHPLADES